MPVATIKDVEELSAMMTLKELQDFLRISRPKAYELANSEGFPTVRLTRAMRIPKDALLRWLDEQIGSSV